MPDQAVIVEQHAHPFTSADRPQGTLRYPAGDERQPLSRTAITTMPTGVSYDAARAVVVLGDGEFGPVGPQVWDYAVGGRGVINSRVNYRKAVPGGKKTSPLDHMHVDEWDPDWTAEFIDLLTVLTRLVELEPEQADVLTQVLAGPVLTMRELALAGVRWPTKPADRKPRFGLATAPDSADEGFDLGP